MSITRAQRAPDAFALGGTPSEVGPGKYDASVRRGVHASGSPAYTAFSSSVPRPIGDSASPGKSSPFVGPGSYLPQGKTVAKADEESSFFRTRAPRFAPTAPGSTPFKESSVVLNPGPGAYNLQGMQPKRAISAGIAGPKRLTDVAGASVVEPPRRPPAIPRRDQSYGYEPGPSGDLVMQTAPSGTYTGTRGDTVGPAFYDPQKITESRKSAIDFSRAPEGPRQPFDASGLADPNNPGPGTYNTLAVSDFPVTAGPPKKRTRAGKGSPKHQRQAAASSGGGDGDGGRGPENGQAQAPAGAAAKPRSPRSGGRASGGGGGRGALYGHRGPMPRALPAASTASARRSRAPSAVFRSNTPMVQDLDYSKPVPGPGEYTRPLTASALLDPHKIQGFGSTVGRVGVPIAADSGDNPGPGSYPDHFAMGARLGNGGVGATGGGGSASMGSLMGYGLMEETPGHVAFGQTAARDCLRKVEKQSLGPGAYDADNKLANALESGLRTKSIGRQGNFGSTSRRFPKRRNRSTAGSRAPGTAPAGATRGFADRTGAASGLGGTSVRGRSRSSASAPPGASGGGGSGGSAYDDDDSVPGPGAYNVAGSLLKRGVRRGRAHNFLSNQERFVGSIIGNGVYQVGERIIPDTAMGHRPWTGPGGMGVGGGIAGSGAPASRVGTAFSSTAERFRPGEVLGVPADIDAPGPGQYEPYEEYTEPSIYAGGSAGGGQGSPITGPHGVSDVDTGLGRASQSAVFGGANSSADGSGVAAGASHSSPMGAEVPEEIRPDIGSPRLGHAGLEGDAEAGLVGSPDMSASMVLADAADSADVAAAGADVAMPRAVGAAGGGGGGDGDVPQEVLIPAPGSPITSPDRGGVSSAPAGTRGRRIGQSSSRTRVPAGSRGARVGAGSPRSPRFGPGVLQGSALHAAGAAQQRRPHSVAGVGVHGTGVGVGAGTGLAAGSGRAAAAAANMGVSGFSSFRKPPPRRNAPAPSFGSSGLRFHGSDSFVPSGRVTRNIGPGSYAVTGSFTRRSFNVTMR